MRNFNECNFNSVEKELSNDDVKKNPDYDLIYEKLLISRWETSQRLGSVNLYQTAVNLYAGLYKPDDVEQLINPSLQFPDKIARMKQSLSVTAKNSPKLEEFVEKIRHVLTREVDYSESVPLEAREQLFQLMQLCEETIIWTDGDTKGVSELDLPGSREQLHKLASAGFYNKMRKVIAEDRSTDHRDVFSVVSAEGKMDFVLAIAEKFSNKGIKKVIIVEDRLKNLVNATKLIKQNSQLDVFPIWVRQGEFKNKIVDSKSLSECIVENNAIENISELTDVISGNFIITDQEKVGAIVDLDGVLSDDEKRKEIQCIAVIKALSKKGWI